MRLRTNPNAHTESRAIPPITAGFEKLWTASGCETPNRKSEELVRNVVVEVEVEVVEVLAAKKVEVFLVVVLVVLGWTVTTTYFFFGSINL